MFNDETQWSWRVAVDTENVTSGVGVGDVVSVPASVTRDPIEELTGEATTQQVRAEHKRLGDRLATYVDQYDVDLDTSTEDLSDGDLLLLASPRSDREIPSFPAGETLYTTPEGLLAD